METIELKIGGQLFNRAWEEMRVIRSLDRLSTSFEFKCTQPTPFNYNDWPIKMGAACEVRVGGKQTVTGYIEDVDIDYTENSHSVMISGRDKTGDLVDCTRANRDKDGNIIPLSVGRDVRVGSIIKMLCKPFGIEVVIDAAAQELANKTFPASTVFDTGATIFEIILKCCKTSGLIPMATTDGKLRLAAVGASTATTRIVSGENVVHGGLRQSNKEVFSVYFTKGFSMASDNTLPAEWQFSQMAKDTSNMVGRYRPFAGLSEAPGTWGTGHNRTVWEMRYRQANARQYMYTLPGLTQADGSLWEPNMVVFVRDPLLGIPLMDGNFIINQVENCVDGRGALTTLHVCSRAKYDTKAKLDMILTAFDSEYAGKATQ